MTPRFLIRCIISNIFIICLILIDFIAKKAVRTETTLVPGLPLSLDDKADSFAGYALSSDFDAPSQSHSQLLDVKQLNAFQDTLEQEDILSHNIGAEFS